eukprot:TRINITY_DN1161_c0_g1_i1.p1 TRINITY_DN1161_c0_g1~~TRINITY_DN1161_c0_g1_i1.p1  ORF type:complete len:602 (-),score=145.00 TRINITY_DN1161_c0_g1_i1:531-2336(-)
MAESSGNSSSAAPRSSSTGSKVDSYIGSLISLTSKSEIRYEGIFYTANEKEATIALQAVRSFGTEGRKKDGPQIPPSEKVYEYIIFRASDIKDLHVKSPPPAQISSQIHSDPAIVSLQSQFSQPSASSKTFVPAVSGGSVPDQSSLGGNANVPSAFRGTSPLYQPTRNLGPWGSTPVPGSGATGLPMPMYWQGYYGPTSGLMPHIQQQHLHFQSPPGIPIPPALQQNVHQSPVLPSIPRGMPASSELNISPNVSMPQHSSETSTGAGSLSGSTAVSTAGGSSFSGVVSVPSSSAEMLSTTLPSNISLASSAFEPNPITDPSKDTCTDIQAMNKAVNVTVPTSSVPSAAQPVPVTTPSSISTSAQPNLVTPGQLLKTGGSISALKNKSLAEDDEPKSERLTSQVGSQTSLSHSQRASSEPILPLPASSSQQKVSPQLNGVIGHSGSHFRRRGRGMDRGGRYAPTQFTEDFDFTAMNEKFNKDEVWGHLGKNEIRDKEDDGEENLVEKNSEEDDIGHPSVPKPVYVKDDFFDTLSCDALDRSRNERKFSEQRRIDTETFGSLTRSRPSRGGRGSGYRGNFRGSYYGGRGNGYGSRGRGGRTYC